MTLRCTRCLMPSTYPGITFDAGGVCNHCREYASPELLGEARLLEKIASRKGREYDCVIGISGGKDSCYVAYLAKKRYGLRALAVCYDFPFMVDLARDNVRRLCDALGLELLVVSSSDNLEYDLMRYHLTSLAATGTTWGQCVFCHYGIDAVLRQTALDREIPFVLSGVTSNEKWWDPGSRMHFLRRRLRSLSLADKAIFVLYQSRAYLKLVDQRRQFPIPGNGPLRAFGRPQAGVGDPETIPVFDYVKWEQNEIEQVLRDETGWTKPDRALSWRYDCVLEPLLDYTYMREFGISSAGLYLCGLIRAGEITRDEAMRVIEEVESREYLDASLRSVLDYLKIPDHVQEKYFRASAGDAT